MLHVFCTYRVKVVAQKPKATNISGQREYMAFTRQPKITHNKYGHLCHYKVIEEDTCMLWSVLVSTHSESQLRPCLDLII
jgi:hypothetical protein